MMIAVKIIVILLGLEICFLSSFLIFKNVFIYMTAFIGGTTASYGFFNLIYGIVFQSMDSSYMKFENGFWEFVIMGALVLGMVGSVIQTEIGEKKKQELGIPSIRKKKRSSIAEDSSLAVAVSDLKSDEIRRPDYIAKKLADPSKSEPHGEKTIRYTVTPQNINSFKQRGYAGDVNAMLALGEYYLGGTTKAHLRKGIRWYERAVAYGSFETISTVREARVILAKLAGEQADSVVDGYKIARKEWRKVYDWSSSEVDYCNKSYSLSKKEKVKTAKYYIQFAAYKMGVYSFLEDRIPESLNALQKSDEIKAKVLFGYILSNQTEQPEWYRLGYEMLNYYFANRLYQACKKTREEEYIYSKAAIRLAKMYQSGIPDCLYPNKEKALQILKMTEATVYNQRNKNMLNLAIADFTQTVKMSY